MRLPRPDAVLVQAAIAGALSFAHLHDLAAAAGQNGWKAWAYPVSVDLLLVAAWHRMRTLRAAGTPAPAAWTWFAIALAASLGANVATAGLLDLGAVPAWLRILVAGWPALAFFGGTLLAHATTGNRPDPAPEPPVYEPEPAAPSVAPTIGPGPEAVEAPETTPALPPAPPPPNPPMPPLSTPVAAVSVPAALVDHARKVADDHQARTGTPIDPDTLRARLGVPPELAAAITAQLVRPEVPPCPARSARATASVSAPCRSPPTTTAAAVRSTPPSAPPRAAASPPTTTPARPPRSPPVPTAAPSADRRPNP